jgi:hypothetical protein
MDTFISNQLISKLKEKPDFETQMSIIYMWVKTNHINKATFMLLIEEVQKMNAPLTNITSTP